MNSKTKLIDSNRLQRNDTQLQSPHSPRRRLNADARACMECLRTVAEPRRLRIALDNEGCPFIEGKYGKIESDDPQGRQLAVYCNHRRLFGQLFAVPGVRRHQTGDDEIRAFFPPEAFEQVAGVIRVKRKRGVSSEAARKAGAKTAFQGTSGVQEAA